MADAERRIDAAAAASREFQIEQVKRLEADAVASGEVARTRNWSMNDVSGKLTLSQTVALMPTAFCTRRMWSPLGRS